MRIVVALGGNALLERGDVPLAEVQAHHVESVVPALAPMAREHQLIVTHGNGPQVGLLALESAADPALPHPYPLDVLGAESQGMVGYLLVQALSNALPDRRVVNLLTRTLVDAHDPAFAEPTKFVGPIYTEAEAHALAEARGWHVRPDGSSWRRVVASPEPLSIVELETISALLAAGVLVVCAGGGGVPVVADDAGALSGVEAVIDKDLTASLLARQVNADVLLILTDVPGVEVGYGTPSARVLERLEANDELMGRLPAGSMGPKVEAARRFAAATGRRAVIGALGDAGSMLEGRAGTTVVAASLPTSPRS